MKRHKYQSKLLGIIYEEALANFEVGAISKERLQEYAAECLVSSTQKVSASKSASTTRNKKTKPSTRAARSEAAVYAQGK